MAQTKAESQSGYDFPLNTRLLDESLKLKEERKIIKERLKSIEKSREEVSNSVYEKVYGDYSSRLKKTDDQLLEKKQDIDRELASLFDTRDKITANLKNHKHALEEIQFRHQLGEFDKQEFQTRAKQEEDKVSRFEQVLSGVQNNIRRYEGLFEGEEDLFGQKEEEEVDEWEEEAKQAQKEEASPPEKSKEWLEETKPNIGASALITIIAGKENVGKSLPINGPFSIGRSHTNQLILKDAKASRQHAEIKTQGNEYVLIDLNSSNGTTVNGQRVHEHILAPNDEIQIGDFVLQFQL